jgi:hypothetical protein
MHTCSVNADNCTEFHCKNAFHRAVSHQALFSRRKGYLQVCFCLRTCQCVTVPSTPPHATLLCVTVPSTPPHATPFRTHAVKHKSLEPNTHYVATCVLVRLDRYSNNQDEILTPTVPHLCCCYLTTLTRTGWSGRLLPRCCSFNLPRSVAEANCC